MERIGYLKNLARRHLVIGEVPLGTILRGLATYSPWADAAWKSTTPPGVIPARYCYTVWLRHLIRARRTELIDSMPRSVVELGPGDSLGTGLAGLLSGVSSYTALDVQRFCALRSNVDTLDQLAALFQRREPVPGDEEFPEVIPKLEDYSFPHDFLTDGLLAESLSPGRVAAIRQVLEGRASSEHDVSLVYSAPWQDVGALPPRNSADMVLSQAAMEHVSNPRDVYSHMIRWLRPGGLLSLSLDYRSHGSANSWNGHWTVNDWLWRIMVGRQLFWINRLSHSAHLSLMRSAGFNVVLELPALGDPLPRHRLAARFSALTDADLATATAFVQAIRPLTLCG